MTTTAEVYFLVRVGSWDEHDLENWVQERMDEAADQHFDQGYESGQKEGLEQGLEDMYKQALDAIVCLR